MHALLALSCLAAAGILGGGGASAAFAPFAPSAARPRGRVLGIGPLYQRRNEWQKITRGDLGSYRGDGPSGRRDRYYDDYGDRDYRGGGGGRDYYDDYAYDPYYYAGRPLFGNSEYYEKRGSSSEDFRLSSRGDRYHRRENLRNVHYGRGRIQDYYTPGEREMQQQRQNQGARYGWQQQYDTKRGNVRGGSSQDFRRGSARDRIQDFLTPGQREKRQQAQNQGARYGWQQQYNTKRGNVRGGSSSDFRRGRERDTYRSFQSPRDRERRQMEDNRALGRGEYERRYGGRGRDGDGYYPGRDGGYDDYGRESFGRRDGYGRRGDYGRDSYDDYGRESFGRRDGYGRRDEYGRDSFGRRDDYYEPEIVRGRSGGGGNYSLASQSSGKRLRNTWDNVKNSFKF